MINLQLTGTREELLRAITALHPSWSALEREAREHVGPVNKKEVWLEQAAALAVLASQYDRPSGRILEIGANRGYTAAVMHFAAPQAKVHTLEPDPTRRKIARENVRPLGVAVRPEVSAAWLELCVRDGIRYDMIFVDGDHNRVRADLPFWNLLRRNGLFVHHDYSRPGSARECPPVYDALNEFAARMEREPDVLVVDDSGVGLWGMYRRAMSEVWDA